MTRPTPANTQLPAYGRLLGLACAVHAIRPEGAGFNASDVAACQKTAEDLRKPFRGLQGTPDVPSPAVLSALSWMIAKASEFHGKSLDHLAPEQADAEIDAFDTVVAYLEAHGVETHDITKNLATPTERARIAQVLTPAAPGAIS